MKWRRKSVKQWNIKVQRFKDLILTLECQFWGNDTHLNYKSLLISTWKKQRKLMKKLKILNTRRKMSKRLVFCRDDFERSCRTRLNLLLNSSRRRIKRKLVCFNECSDQNSKRKCSQFKKITKHDNTLKRTTRKFVKSKMHFEIESKKNAKRMYLLSKSQRKRKKKIWLRLKTECLQMMKNKRFLWFNKSFETEKSKTNFPNPLSNSINFSVVLNQRKKLKLKLTISHFQRAIKRSN